MAPLTPPLIIVSRNSAYGGGVVLIVLAVWAYFGFPSPETLADWPTAANQCVKFADDNKQKLFFGSEEQVRAIGSWLKKGRIVVEVGAFEPGEKSFIPRLCVVGRGRIEIVSILENA